MILDTCALLWLASGDKKLSRSALKEINAACRREFKMRLVAGTK